MDVLKVVKLCLKKSKNNQTVIIIKSNRCLQQFQGLDQNALIYQIYAALM